MKRIAVWLACGLCAVAGRAETWTVSDALRYARTNAPDARIARQRMSAAFAVLEQANSAFWPAVRLHSSYTRTDNPVSVFGMALNQRSYSPSLDFNRVPDADDWNVRGVVSVPLYAGGRNKAGRAAAQAGVQAAAAEAEATRNALEFEVARTCATVAKTRRFLEAAEAGVRSYETNRWLAQTRLDGGSILRSEVLELEVRLAGAREDWVRARNGANLAVLGLKRLLGLDRPIDLAEGLPSLAGPGEGKVASRPELNALAARVEAAEAEVRRAEAGHRPKVEAFGQVEHDLGWEFDGNGQSYAAGVVAQWDLWDGHRTRGKVREAQASLEAAREEYEKLRLGLDVELEQSRLQLQEADERLQVTRDAVAQAEEAARLERARFEQGLALATQLIDAETAVITARVRVAEAEADRFTAAAAVRRCHGLSQLEGVKE